MKLTINISPEDLKTLKLITSNGINGTVESQIKNAIKYYIVNWIQFIPYIERHKNWIDKKELECFIPDWED